MSLVIKEEIAKVLLKNKAITLNPKEPYTFVSGIKSPIYTDNRLLTGIPAARSEIVNCLIYLMKEQSIKADVIAGTATAGIAWAALLAEKLNLPMVYVKAKKKEHGAKKQIEGFIEPGSSVVVVEDLISTGSSSINTAEALRQAGNYVAQCIAIFTYSLAKAKENFDNANIRLYSLTDLNTVADIAEKEEIISESEKEMVLEWQKDPDVWAEKMGFDD